LCTSHVPFWFTCILQYVKCIWRIVCRMSLKKLGAIWLWVEETDLMQNYLVQEQFFEYFSFNLTGIYSKLLNELMIIVFWSSEGVLFWECDTVSSGSCCNIKILPNSCAYNINRRIIWIWCFYHLQGLVSTISPHILAKLVARILAGIY
jgi:hypothetical protein